MSGVGGNASISIGLDVDAHTLDTLLTQVEELSKSVETVSGKFAPLNKKYAGVVANSEKLSRSSADLNKKIGFDKFSRSSVVLQKEIGFGKHGGVGGGRANSRLVGNMENQLGPKSIGVYGAVSKMPGLPIPGLPIPALVAFGAAVGVVTAGITAAVTAVKRFTESLETSSAASSSMLQEYLQQRYMPNMDPYARYRAEKIGENYDLHQEASRYSNALRSEDLAKFDAQLSLTSSYMGDFSQMLRANTESAIKLKAAHIVLDEVISLLCRTVGSAIVDFVSANSMFLEKLATVGDGLLTIINRVYVFFQRIHDAWMSLMEQLFSAVRGVFSAIGNFLGPIFDGIATLLSPLGIVVGDVCAWFESLAPPVDFFKSNLKNLSNAYESAYETLTDSADFAADSIFNLGMTPHLRGMWDIGTSGLASMSDYENRLRDSSPYVDAMGGYVGPDPGYRSQLNGGQISHGLTVPSPSSMPYAGSPTLSGYNAGNDRVGNLARHNQNDFHIDITINAQYLDEQLADRLIERLEKELARRIDFSA